MKKIILFLILPYVLISCENDPNPVISDVSDSYLNGSGAFILNEGNFRAGNGSLSFFSYDSAKIYNHVFLNVNGNTLGDVPYSMGISGNKGYIVVNNSSKIEVVKINNLESIATIKGFISPRYISFVNYEKAYITSLYSDSVAIISLSENAIKGYINLKHTSESIISINSKAYVANWTGGNKIFVINTNTDLVTDSITVGKEPESMVIDKNQTLWVLCNGGWARESNAELYAINTQTNTIEKKFTFQDLTDSPTNLQIDGEGETLYYLLNGVQRMNIEASSLPTMPSITSGDRTFYKLGINPENDEIFITDVVDYQQKGYLFQYKNDGTFVAKMQADIIPGTICFKKKEAFTTE